MEEYMEIMQACYEATCNVQNINYEFLKEKYDSEVIGESSIGEKAKDLLRKLMDKIEEFFNKVLDAMKRTLTRVVLIIDKSKGNILNTFANNKKGTKELQVPNYSSYYVQRWAIDQMNIVFNNIKKVNTENGEKVIYNPPFKNEEDKQMVDTKPSDELDELRTYKANIKAVENCRKYIRDIYRYETSKKTEETEGKAALNLAFQISQTAVKLINKRVNAACTVLLRAFKKSNRIGIQYKKLL